MFRIEKEHKKSTLMSMKKEELVERIMFLEHNNNVLHERIEIQARNVEKFLKKELIPCIGRMPEDDEEVLVWYEGTDWEDKPHVYYAIARYMKDRKCWSGTFKLFNANPIAWMPLPDPYREDGEQWR